MTRNDKSERWLNVVGLVKDGEKYVFVHDGASHKALLGVFGSFARNPELNFSWHDAAVLSRMVRDNEAEWLCGPRSRELRTG